MRKIKTRVLNACHQDDSTSSEGHSSIDSDERVDRLVSTNRKHYLHYNQPKYLRKTLNPFQPTSEEKKVESSPYKLPTRDSVRKSHRKWFLDEKQKLLEDISHTDKPLEGMLTVKEQKDKVGARLPNDKKPVEDYLKFYSPRQMASLEGMEVKAGGTTAASGLGAVLQGKLQMNFIKGNLMSAIKSSMTKFKSQRNT